MILAILGEQLSIYIGTVAIWVIFYLRDEMVYDILAGCSLIYFIPLLCHYDH